MTYYTKARTCRSAAQSYTEPTSCVVHLPLFVVLQAFIRDAEYVDSLSASHEAFLSNEDLGVHNNLLCFIT